MLVMIHAVAASVIAMPTSPRTVAIQMRAKGRFPKTAQADRGHAASPETAVAVSTLAPGVEMLNLR
jgi:hypothetical protein